MNAFLTEAAVEAEHAVSEASITPEGVGLLAFTGLITLLLITVAFRSVGTRH